MARKTRDLSTARRKKGWSLEEIESYAKRRSAECKKVASKKEEPDYLASGTQKSIEDICDDDGKEHK